jgi:D-proline reductase (dithiol) PrdB
MVRLEQYEEHERRHLLDLPCPTFDSTPFVAARAPSTARVAIISTAGLHRRVDRPFAVGEAGYRVIPNDTDAADLVMSHISTNFDRTGFQLDINMVLPIERLEELVEEGFIESVAAYHYSFMGATDPAAMETEARNLAGLLRQDRVSCALLVPV